MIISLPFVLYNCVIFIISICIGFVGALTLFMFLKSYGGCKFKTVNVVKEYIDSNYKDLIDSIKTPLILTSVKNPDKIIFYNKEFKKEFLQDGYCVNDSVAVYVSGQTAENLLDKEKVAICYKEKKFNVSAEKIGDFIVVCFQNDTKYKDLKKKYIDSRVCVGLVMFDNKEELSESLEDEKMSIIRVAVDNILSSWAKEINGILKKLNDGKYIIIFEEKYLKSFIAEKFKILNKIHEAKIDDHKYATISIGISRGAENFLEAKIWAEKSLNMALGRGGDQVAIKNKSKYEFFGGASKGLEKRSKVRTRVAAMAILEKIELSDSVFIMGHKYSDFDVIGAAAGFYGVCSKIKKKKTYVVIDKNHSLASLAISHLEKSGAENIFINPEDVGPLITENSLLIVVDTHSVKFLESSDVYQKINNVIVVDHHRLSVDKIKNATIFFHEPFASSTCEMVAELVQYMGDKYLKKSEAECLLAGMMLDTKNFSLKSGIRTFEAAAYLKKKGADNLSVKRMFANSMDTYKLRCKIIETAYIFDDCAIAKLEEKIENMRVSCSQAADELLNIKNVKASFVIFSSEEFVNISARSLGDVNVQVIMEKLGGGGHQTMAAAQIEGLSIEEVEQRLLKIIKEHNISLEK